MQKNLIRKIISAVMALGIVSSLIIPASVNADDDLFRRNTIKITSAENLRKPPFMIKSAAYNSDVTHGNYNLSDLTSVYESFPTDEYINLCSQFKQVCDTKADFSDVLECAENLNTLVYYASDLYSMAQVIYYFDTSDTDSYNELLNASEAYQKAYTAFSSAMQYALSNDYYYNDFAEAIGKDAADSYLEINDGDESPSDYNIQINKLNNEYHSLINNNGTESEIADVYLKIVNLNNSYAKSMGYNNYMEMAYEMYGRDYTIDDALNFCQSINENLSELYSCAYDDMSGKSNYKQYRKLKFTAQEAIDAVGGHISNISSEIQNAYDFLTEYETYSIVSSSEVPDRADGAFTIYFQTMAEPYIFLTSENSADDVKTLIHEFGHYNEMYQTGQAGYSLDLSEISSQAFELLYMPYYSDIFGNEYQEIAEESTVVSVLWALVSGCAIAEFETSVYLDENIRADEIISLYDNLHEKYIPDSGLEWTDVSHLFESPGYYISYATSAAAAFEIWNTSVNDMDTAISDYIEISSFGSNGTFKDTLSECGMNDVFNEETISGIAATINKKYNLINNSLLYDMDGDGEITSYDALIVLQMVTGLNPTDLKADFDNDGAITSYDALAVLQYIVSGS